MDIKNIYVYKIGFGDCSLLELSLFENGYKILP